MSVLDQILNSRFDKDEHEDNGKEHKADWKGDWGRDNDGKGGPWQEDGKFCWKDDGDKKWDAKNDDGCESGGGGGGGGDGCDFEAVLADLQSAVDVIQKAIEGLDCTQCENAHADSFENTDVLA